MLTENLLTIYIITRRHTAEAYLFYASGLPVFYENFELTEVQQEATWKWETNCNMEVTNLLSLTYKSNKTWNLIS